MREDQYTLQVPIAPGERRAKFNTIRAMVRTWLDTPFDGGRHEFRVRLLESHFRHATHHENNVPDRD